MTLAKKPTRPNITLVRRVCLVLIVLALIATGARIFVAWLVPAPSGTGWQVSEQYKLQADKPGARVSLAVPIDSATSHLYGQNLNYTGLRLQPPQRGSEGTRRIAATATQAGPLTMEADFSIRMAPTKMRATPSQQTLSAEDRHALLGSETGIDPSDPSVTKALESVNTAQAISKGDTANAIFIYLHQHLTFSPKHGAQTASAALQSGKADDLGYARAMVALCRATRIPARVVTGFVLSEQAGDDPRHWVQVHPDQQWVAYDPSEGYARDLPADYVAFSHGAPLLDLDHAKLVNVDYSVDRQDLPSATGAKQFGPLAILDLARLPLSARSALATLLLLPLGALLNAAVRGLIGIETYGTFTPALMALAAVYVDWLTALVIFVVVTIIALLGRSMLPGLRLTRAPRLTIVFTLVAMAMALAISIMAYFGLLTGAQVVLLPIVILTSLMDRIYTVADEDGPVSALTRLAWTGITAIGCFFILGSNTLGEWLVAYPELHLITIAAVILLAAYRGPQLIDYPAFSWLAPQRPNKKTSKTEDSDD